LRGRTTAARAKTGTAKIQVPARVPEYDFCLVYEVTVVAARCAAFKECWLKAKISICGLGVVEGTQRETFNGVERDVKILSNATETLMEAGTE
jgi:hypothetical protein